MIKHILNRLLQIQFVRRILGGVGGATLALVLYGAYGMASDAVHAYILAPSSVEKTEASITKTQQKELFEHIGALAREKKEQL